MSDQRGFVAGSVVGSAGAALTSAVASGCCIGPLAITLLGVNGVILAAAVKPYSAILDRSAEPLKSEFNAAVAGSVVLTVLPERIWGRYTERDSSCAGGSNAAPWRWSHTQPCCTSAATGSCSRRERTSRSWDTISRG